MLFRSPGPHVPVYTAIWELESDPGEVLILSWPEAGATTLYQTELIVFGVSQHAGGAGSPAAPLQLLFPWEYTPSASVVALQGRSFAGPEPYDVILILYTALVGGAQVSTII